MKHNGNVQIAYYSHGVVFDAGRTVIGIWHLTQDDDTCNNGEEEILDGPLLPLLSWIIEA
ncbi:hypothetical protein RKT74_23580 (plasmid) [Leclercia pneumoniae]|nr:hypothetical protein [Leclercia pneumoniae]MCV2513348.1 hypothetical protein [Leclercia pneumoniae]WNN83823.1 hypothetical protein RKT74_23580 [Leclercia pneumoniae]